MTSQGSSPGAAAGSTSLPGELVEILVEIHPYREAAEEAAELILADQGQDLLPDLIWNLTNHRCDQAEAARIWQGLLAHRAALAQQLRRDPGLRVAILDYFCNVLGRNARPRVVPPDILDRLFRDATSDPLTGLANRRAFQGRLHDEIVRSRRYGKTFVLALFDADNFKAVNDAKGHAEGDRILRRISEAVRKSVRESDVGARWGGEEFVVLMPETAKRGGAMVADRLRAQVECDLALDGVTLSGGVAAFPSDGADGESVLRFADRCLYRAKSEGKNRVSLSPKERRRFPRLNESLPFRICPVGGEDWMLNGKTTDISRGGLGFRHKSLLWVASKIRGEVVVGGRMVNFQGRIAHVEETAHEEFAIGIQFTEIAPDDADRLTARGRPGAA